MHYSKSSSSTQWVVMSSLWVLTSPKTSNAQWAPKSHYFCCDFRSLRTYCPLNDKVTERLESAQEMRMSCWTTVHNGQSRTKHSVCATRTTTRPSHDHHTSDSWSVCASTTNLLLWRVHIRSRQPRQFTMRTWASCTPLSLTAIAVSSQLSHGKPVHRARMHQQEMGLKRLAVRVLVVLVGVFCGKILFCDEQ